ncbi:MAG TPA: hypothetical protein DCM05_07835 [Elusimicrobia bacterium]|nr:hypothetical protein [Elusimicrobiota bacterium]
MPDATALAFAALLLVGGAAKAGAQPLASDPLTEDSFHRAMVSLYNLDYEDARAEVRRLLIAQPSNPLAYLGEAGLLWWQAEAEYGLFRDSPTMSAVFEQDVLNAISLAERLAGSKDPVRQADGHFVAGMGWGVHGQAELQRGNWLKAYSDGKKAIKHLKKCVKIDPEYQDAYLGLGIFDYQTDRLPAALKLPMLFVHRGDAKRGIARILQSMEKGRFARDQAGAFLLSIYMKEGDWDSALPLLRRLREQFPQSAYFRYREASLLAMRGDWDASYRDVLEILSLSSSEPDLLGRKQLSLFCGLVGTQCLDQTYTSALVRWLDRALAEPSSARWTSLLYLYRGMARDVLGQRVDAVHDYSKAVAARDVPPAHEYARRCLGSACDRDETLRILKELARKGGGP